MVVYNSKIIILIYNCIKKETMTKVSPKPIKHIVARRLDKCKTFNATARCTSLSG